MKKHISHLTVLCMTLFCGFAGAQELYSIDAKRAVILKSEVEKVLKEKWSGSKALTYGEFDEDVQVLFQDEKGESPIAFESDFNNDDKKDLVLVVGNKTDISVLVFLAKDNSFEVIKLDEWKRSNKDDGEMTYVTRLSKAEVQVKKGAKRAPSDVIQVETYLGAVNAYFIKDFEAIRYKGLIW